MSRTPGLKRALVVTLKLKKDQTKVNQVLYYGHSLRQVISVHYQTRVNNHMIHEDATAELHTSAGATPGGEFAGENSSNKWSDGVRASVSEGLSKQ